MIISLVIHIILFQVVREIESPIIQPQIKEITLEIVDIPKTWQKKKIQKPYPPPSRPIVPIPTEEEYIPEDEVITFPNLDLSKIPAPPPFEYDYENYTFTPYQTPPEMIKRKSVLKKLRYPKIAEQYGLQGSTVIAFLIDKDGSVIKCYVLYSSGFKILDDEALRVAKIIKFRPAMQRDKPAKVWIVIPFKFHKEMRKF